ncbi:MAG: L-threonylcarbamoyladenylate synthase, partial [bacterium]|nr:L-threonylcarbamoyladenylate synthase [bacterium]
PLDSPAPAAPPAAPGARVLGRRAIDPDAPDVGLIEDAVDCLLEGGIVALPTETVYGLAVDATNPVAVERLYALKERARAKAITIMVDSPRLLASIACNLTVESRRLMEAFWPGPLTIIFQKRPGTFTHVSANDTIGVRLPDHSIPLAIMQALARPLACTSANLSGRPEARTADEIAVDFGGAVNLILDAGALESSPPWAVGDVTGESYRVRRVGAIGYSQLAAIVGDKLEPEP